MGLVRARSRPLSSSVNRGLPMQTFDLEIGLHRTERDDYAVDLRFRGRGDVDISPERGKADIDVEALDEAIQEDPAGIAYGMALFGQVFSTPKLVAYFDKAR